MFYFLFVDIAWLISAYATAVYINDRLLDFRRYTKRSFRAFALYIVIVLFFIFIYHYNYSRLFIVLNLGVFGFFLVVSRIIFIWCGKYFHDKSRYNKKIIVLGYNEIGKKLVSYFNANKERVWFEGYFEEIENVNELSLYPILGSPNECISYAIKNKINEIYSTFSPEGNPFIYKLINVAEKNMIRFKFVPDLHLFINRNFYIDYLRDMPILSLRPEPLEDIANRIKKRFFDIFFSIIIIICILSWITPILALLVKLTSKGPIFFTQYRSGKDDQMFKCYKFRSLKLNRECESKQVTQGDSRYTIIGRFLRKTNLDELPQFFNVLVGNMSIVGPRPHMLNHTQDFSKIIDEYMIRQFIKPGITGWAQVNGFRGEIKNNEQLRQRIQHDIWYMENWGIWLDIYIIILTFYITLKGDKNAY
jgi:putative colanic acid biosynthesis UDP-glucose lipid carrier transferase